MNRSKSIVAFAMAIFLFYGCRKTDTSSGTPDINSLTGNYMVSGTHYKWYWYSLGPYDSTISNLYNRVNDTLILSNMGNSGINAVLNDSGNTYSAQLLYSGHATQTGGYIFLSGTLGSPDYDSLVVTNIGSDSLSFFFTSNLPRSGGDTYQMRGLKMH